MIIVGVGSGPGMMPRKPGGRRPARLIYGSKRSIDLAGNISTRDCISGERIQEALISAKDGVVLSTGVPPCSRLGYRGRVIPGISSQQVACARLKLSELVWVPSQSTAEDDPEPSHPELSRQIRLSSHR